MSNICFIVRLFRVILMERKLSEHSFSMKIDASSVEVRWLFTNKSPCSYFHQFIRFPLTLEKTNSCQHSTLSNLMSKRPQQVSLFLDAAQSTSSEVIDFQIWFSPAFQMQSRQARSDPLHGISIPNSSSGLFLHLHLLVFFSTSLWDCCWSWNG